jgi:hypothetical protein
MQLETNIYNDDETEMVEWINGERMSIKEYEQRLEDEKAYAAGLYLLQMGAEMNWIFGMDSK